MYHSRFQDLWNWGSFIIWTNSLYTITAIFMLWIWIKRNVYNSQISLCEKHYLCWHKMYNCSFRKIKQKRDIFTGSFKKILIFSHVVQSNWCFYQFMFARYMITLSKMRLTDLIPTLILSFFFWGVWLGDQLSFSNRSTSHTEVKSQGMILQLTRSEWNHREVRSQCHSIPVIFSGRGDWKRRDQNY